jgi:CheY-like chemotaxis protein
MSKIPHAPKKEIKSKIIVAEDQIINMQVIKSQIAEHGLLDNCEFCFNGEEALVKAK